MTVKGAAGLGRRDETASPSVSIGAPPLAPEEVLTGRHRGLDAVAAEPAV
jgi:hypothetical protein